eukprot:1106313-Rhodomonas_salina.3
MASSFATLAEFIASANRSLIAGLTPGSTVATCVFISGQSFTAGRSYVATQTTRRMSEREGTGGEHRSTINIALIVEVGTQLFDFTFKHLRSHGLASAGALTMSDSRWIRCSPACLRI